MYVEKTNWSFYNRTLPKSNLKSGSAPVYRRAAHSICNLKDSVRKEITIIFYSSSNYNYHFTIKELSEEFETQFTFLGENTENYKRNYKRHIPQVTTE